MMEDGTQNDATMRIEVAYADPERTALKVYSLEAPATVADALALAACDPCFAGIDLTRSTLGIFGRVVSRDRALAHGDRVEIYRPLTADPKLVRRSRAASKSCRS
jgi:putative ubiquitin-RnfH superfamily antitoxin RatB of RatAB toxin-antitoxin module